MFYFCSLAPYFKTISGISSSTILWLFTRRKAASFPAVGAHALTDILESFSPDSVAV